MGLLSILGLPTLLLLLSNDNLDPKWAQSASMVSGNILLPLYAPLQELVANFIGCACTTEPESVNRSPLFVINSRPNSNQQRTSILRSTKEMLLHSSASQTFRRRIVSGFSRNSRPSMLSAESSYQSPPATRPSSIQIISLLYRAKVPSPSSPPS